MTLDDWAYQWRLSPEALADLKTRLGMDGTHATPHPKKFDEYASESRVQSLVRLEASQKDVVLWRNNVGALLDERGVPVRYGLANESKAMNETFKSSDLIGIRRRIIQPHEVGCMFGQFVAREVKEGGWTYTGTGREVAQLTFGQLILAHGGDFAFAPGQGTL